MFKRIVLCLLMLLCTCISYAALSETVYAKDGLLGSGEYEGGGIKLEDYETLVVAGGGTYRMEARDNSYIKVEYTSVSSDPSNPVTNSKGIWDIALHDNSNLLWLDGAVDEITLYKDATAVLKGGYIDALSIYHRPQDSCYVEIWCQDGWSWVYNGSKKVGITGLWLDGTSFDIGFNDSGPFVTADYVNPIPEPATMALLGLGGLLIRRRR